MLHMFCIHSSICSVFREINPITTIGALFNYYNTKRFLYYFSRQNFSSKMPKPATHTVALKNHRQKLKEKGQKYSPGTVNLQVLGSGANGAPRSLYMFTDQSRYLFNCGEGTQRLAHEHKMKLSKLEHIFVTHSTWDNIGGLPGVSLTIQDVGVPQITIHGPPGTDEVFEATRRFVVLRHLTVKMAKCTKDVVFEDNVMKVQYVPMLSSAAKQWISTPPAERTLSMSPERNLVESSSDDDVDYYAYWKTGSRPNSPSQDKEFASHKKRRFSSPERRSKENRLPAGSVSMAYICHLNDRLGSLNLKACVAQGVPPGPLLGSLKAGKDVTLPDGRVVLSKDVTSADEPGPVYIVVECPNEQFLDSLIEEEAFKKTQSDSNDLKFMAYLVVHFTPAHIMDNQRYREWMGKFPPSTYHLVLNNSNDCLGSVAVHRIQHKLNMLSSHIFPLLNPPDTEDHSQVKKQNEDQSLKNLFSIVKGYTFNSISLRPQRVLDCSPKLVVEPEQYRQEVMAVEGFPEALRMLETQLLDQNENGSTRRFPQVVFLGTGSCIPNKTRNTSGILLHLSESSCMVLDCGEATYGQIVRLYGESRSDIVLKNLRAIYVSHLHADHHIGLIGLLKARLRLSELSTPDTLYLLAPQQIRTWLNTYHHHFEHILQGVQLIPNGEMLLENCTLESSTKSQLLDYLGLSQVQTCAVKHCPNAFGVCFTHRDGWKITYSGDTMPCDDLIRLGKGSDLLIHEATMEDDLEEEAKLKMHSTTSQAIHVGRQMEAQFTLLTHFSQRYANVPIFNDSFTSDVGIAFDNMQVCLDDLQKLPLMYPALKLMFAEHYEEMELKALKRQLQKEREMARSSL